MRTKFISALVLTIPFFINISLFAQKKETVREKYFIVSLDSLDRSFIGYNLCSSIDAKGKRVYIFNARYRLNKNRSYVGSDSDFSFTSYIFPENGSLVFFEVKNQKEITKKKIKGITNFRNQLLSNKIINDLEIVLKIGQKYYQFANTKIYSHAFNLKEDYHYFPQYSVLPNKFELNLLDKPYSRETMDSLRKVEMKDSSSLKRFDTFLDTDKWYIKSLDKQKNTINFWIRLSSIQPQGYSFGRITNEITYKINFGITDFLIDPRKPIFSDEYYKEGYKAVQFTFEKIEDLKKLIVTNLLKNEPKKEINKSDEM